MVYNGGETSGLDVDIKLLSFACKKETAVYTTAVPKLANLFFKSFLTFINATINTLQGVFQQWLRQSQHSTSQHVDRSYQQGDPHHHPP